jgi:hypothetical protein
MSDIDDLSFTLSEDEQAQGMALLCMARATSDCEIETQCDWGYSLGVCEWKGEAGGLGCLLARARAGQAAGAAVQGLPPQHADSARTAPAWWGPSVGCQRPLTCPWDEAVALWCAFP